MEKSATKLESVKSSEKKPGGKREAYSFKNGSRIFIQSSTLTKEGR
mgnify:CR=1 FL=1